MKPSTSIDITAKRIKEHLISVDYNKAKKSVLEINLAHSVVCLELKLIPRPPKFQL